MKQKLNQDAFFPTMFAYGEIWLMLMFMLKYYERKHCSIAEKCLFGKENYGPV
jgi:hypothetical protein